MDSINLLDVGRRSAVERQRYSDSREVHQCESPSSLSASQDKSDSSIRYQRYKAVVDRLVDRSDFALSDLHQSCGDSRQEEFHIVTLDTKNQVIDTHPITVGTLDASLVHPREVFRPAIKDAPASRLHTGHRRKRHKACLSNDPEKRER